MSLIRKGSWTVFFFVMTGSTFGPEPEVGVHLDVNGFYCTCALERGGGGEPFQKRQTGFLVVAQQNRVAEGACGFRRSHSFLVHHPEDDAVREQQTIPVPRCVAGSDVLRRQCPSELARKVRVAGNSSYRRVRTLLLAPIPNLRKIVGGRCDVEASLDLCYTN